MESFISVHSDVHGEYHPNYSLISAMGDGRVRTMGELDESKRHVRSGGFFPTSQTTKVT